MQVLDGVRDGFKSMRANLYMMLLNAKHKMVSVYTDHLNFRIWTLLSTCLILACKEPPFTKFTCFHAVMNSPLTHLAAPGRMVMCEPLHQSGSWEEGFKGDKGPIIDMPLILQEETGLDKKVKFIIGPSDPPFIDRLLTELYNKSNSYAVWIYSSRFHGKSQIWSRSE